MTEEKSNNIVEKFECLHGKEYVLSDEESCILYAQDIYSKTIPALAIIRPKNKEELSEAIKLATKYDCPIIPRGGGMSYSQGYVPLIKNSIIVDFCRMNEILEINEEDMFVTVESGCTWQKLYEALKTTNLRTPFWGTLSGISATIGGTLSQNGIFWGSTKFGSAVDSVIGLEVILGDGNIVSTGSNAQRNAMPFFRHYGPDLTGLFTCDNGALGFKTSATLKLIPKREYREYASFKFNDFDSLFKAMSKISKNELVDVCVGFDPYLQNIRMQRESLSSDLKNLAGVIKGNKNRVIAMKDTVKIALSGRRYMNNVEYSVHLILEEKTQESATTSIVEVKRICNHAGGSEIESSIPKILRANPFTPLNNIIGPRGERWMPIHVIIPHSKANQAMREIQQLLAKHQDKLDKNKIGVGFLYTVISNNGFVIEPVFFTPDSIDEIHKEVVEDGILKNIECFEGNPVARGLTNTLRYELFDLFEDIGGVHMQIGKSYNFRKGLNIESWNVIENIKHIVDPNGLINPGSLGLNLGDDHN